MLKNITEVLARQKLEEILRSEDCCKCEQCKEDILAYALNQLPPHYVSTDEGSLYVKAKVLSSEYDLEIVKALAAAIQVVSQNPRHKK